MWNTILLWQTRKQDIHYHLSIARAIPWTDRGFELVQRDMECDFSLGTILLQLLLFYELKKSSKMHG